jgi:hypothetical protein
VCFDADFGWGTRELSCPGCSSIERGTLDKVGHHSLQLLVDGTQVPLFMGYRVGHHSLQLLVDGKELWDYAM